MEEARSGCCGGKKRSWHDQETVRQLVVRLNRIEGQVRGIRRMIEEDVYCDDVLNQISSVRSAINGVARLLLEKHMKHCLREQLLEGGDEAVDEALKTIFRLIR
ncbi:MAG: metal-sensing transcriptional repressor [Firmicutes bacterium]|jgi:DNA-binding FrmR family transcriptional regulator|nr:metal-sensing transcriptional repressor [Bacillota bacterium]HPU01394.1 metal-sensitive transcriptional regulator [Bacillota bacterium]